MIILCVRWYLRFSLSYRDLKEIMAERNLAIDHVTIGRWVQRYAPELSKRCRRELRHTTGSWRVDETYLRVAGKWTYLYRVGGFRRQQDRFLSLTESGCTRSQAVHGELIKSCGDWSLVQASTVAPPCVRIEIQW
jgi:hypothetical protein